MSAFTDELSGYIKKLEDRNVVINRRWNLYIYTAISKNVVGEDDECQLSNGDCPTEKKCGY